MRLLIHTTCRLVALLRQLESTVLAKCCRSQQRNTASSTPPRRTGYTWRNADENIRVKFDGNGQITVTEADGSSKVVVVVVVV